MQLTQSTPLNSSVKGSFNDIIFTLCMSCTINLVNSHLKNLITPYIDGRREYESMLCPIKFFRLLYNACNLLIPTF